LTETNPFSSLKIDDWYKTLIPLGGIIIILSIIYPVQTITVKELFLIGSGIFLIGIGEWKNVKYYTKFISASAFNPFIRITQPFRANDPLGIFLELLGIVALIVAFLNFFGIIDVLN